MGHSDRALLAGEVDCYAEYSGTLLQEILAGQEAPTRARLAEVLAALGIRMSAPLGFQNNYAIAVPEALGARRRPAGAAADLLERPAPPFVRAFVNAQREPQRRLSQHGE